MSRQPVQARSTATRAALLDAAIECLCADGYAAVTTANIARRAGVSRGAQLHHFSTKAELMAAAVEHVLSRRVQEFREEYEKVAARPDRIDAVVDLLWSRFTGPAFVAWVELWIAARTDPDLAAIIAETDRRFTEETRLLFVEIAASLHAGDPHAMELLRDFGFAMMTGVALQRFIERGQRPVADYLDMLKELVRETLARTTPIRGRT
jgi:AcrR family transcriptional regulator